MKKIVLAFALLCFSITSIWAQSEKYVKAMQEKVAAIDSVRNPQALLALSASFERIAEAEKTQWLPYYYASLAQLNAAYMMSMEKPNPLQTDPMADKAEALLAKAEAMTEKNSEVFILKKMIATLRMMADPMNRFMTYAPKAAEALQTAKALNPANPRALLLEAQDKYYTPEQFGGSKAEAKKLLEEALKKYASFTPDTPLHPVWGKPSAVYFLSQMK